MITLLEIVSSGMYITSLPQYIHPIAEQFGLKEIHPDMRRGSFPSSMIYRQSALENPHVKAYIDAVRLALADFR